MVTIKINPIQHAKLKEYARNNGLKLEFVTEIMVSKFLESLNEPKQQQTVDSVEIVEIKQPEMVQTIEVVKSQKKEGATKGMCLFANSPYADIELLTEKINEQLSYILHRLAVQDMLRQIVHLVDSKKNGSDHRPYSNANKTKSENPTNIHNISAHITTHKNKIRIHDIRNIKQ